jgi:hypothetical protein
MTTIKSKSQFFLNTSVHCQHAAYNGQDFYMWGRLNCKYKRLSRQAKIFNLLLQKVPKMLGMLNLFYVYISTIITYKRIKIAIPTFICIKLNATL